MSCEIFKKKKYIVLKYTKRLAQELKGHEWGGCFSEEDQDTDHFRIG